MSRALPISALLFVVLCACALPQSHDGVDDDIGTSREAITGGWDDDGDPDVVALMNGGSLTCTGTLIASDLVLTAAHCVVGLPIDSVIAGSDPRTPTSRSSIVSVTPHPVFDRTAGTHDIAVVRISPPIDVPMRPLLFAPLYPSDVGAPVRFVGFGLSGDDRPLRKRLGISQIAAIAEETFDIQGDSQPCRGDSGGPTLLRLEGVEVLAGVHSSGPGDCAGYATETRVDANAAFLGHFLDSTEYSLAPTSAGLNSQCSATPSRAPMSSSCWLVVAGLGVVVLTRARSRLTRTRRALATARKCALWIGSAALVVVIPGAAGCAEWNAGRHSAQDNAPITMREPARDAGPGASRDPDDDTRDAGGAPPPPASPPPSTTPAPPAPPPAGATSGCAPRTITCLESCADQTCADGCFAADPSCSECLNAAFDSCITRHGCAGVLDALDECAYASGCADEECVVSWCDAELSAAQSCLPAGACDEDEAACLP